ncbi:hypothetical protein J6590_073799 [Homalodisca vitripennis]|nr:hypothetical protein J6590_073799 [Homalodisca vitripennis]
MDRDDHKEDPKKRVDEERKVRFKSPERTRRSPRRRERNEPKPEHIETLKISMWTDVTVRSFSLQAIEVGPIGRFSSQGCRVSAHR